MFKSLLLRHAVIARSNDDLPRRSPASEVGRRRKQSRGCQKGRTQLLNHLKSLILVHSDRTTPLRFQLRRGAAGFSRAPSIYISQIGHFRLHGSPSSPIDSTTTFVRFGIRSPPSTTFRGPAVRRFPSPRGKPYPTFRTPYL